MIVLSKWLIIGRTQLIFCRAESHMYIGPNCFSNPGYFKIPFVEQISFLVDTFSWISTDASRLTPVNASMCSHVIVRDWPIWCGPTPPGTGRCPVQLTDWLGSMWRRTKRNAAYAENIIYFGDGTASVTSYHVTDRRVVVPRCRLNYRAHAINLEQSVSGD